MSRRIFAAWNRSPALFWKDLCPESNFGKVPLASIAILTPQRLKRASRSRLTGAQGGQSCINPRLLIILTKFTAPARRQRWSRSFVLML